MKAEGARRHDGSMRSTTAWPGIAGDARTASMLKHKNSWNPEWVSTQTHEYAEPLLRLSVKQQNRQSVEAALCPSTDTDARFHGIPTIRQSAIQCMK